MKAINLFLMSSIIMEVTCRKKLVGYWGDNSSGSEKELKYYCDLDIYDTIILMQLSQNDHAVNKDGLPSLNFANHCNNNPLLTEDYNYNLYKRCPLIEDHIRHCQRKGIKMLLNVGGPGSQYIGWNSKKHAYDDAFLWWNLFFGGDESPKIRTFGSVRLDGLNLHLVASRKDYVIDFIENMRFLMTKRNATKQYVLTVSPDCYTLDIRAAFIYDAITIATNSFDAFFVDFAHQNCYLSSKDFVSYFNKWTSLLRGKQPDLYLTLSGSDQGSQRNFIQPQDVQEALRKNDVISQIKGITLNDVGDDSLNLVRANKRYSYYIRMLLDDPKFDVLSITTTTTTTTTTRAPKKSNGGGRSSGGGGLRVINRNSNFYYPGKGTRNGASHLVMFMSLMAIVASLLLL
uniref:GH18 domain-containing protein n=1 Tax=Clytia hemisphaerica TaxID=252671 RepID=A0A7M5X840_9CNID|eukprot:TCONS_00015170-protein